MVEMISGFIGFIVAIFIITKTLGDRQQTRGEYWAIKNLKEREQYLFQVRQKKIQNKMVYKTLPLLLILPFLLYERNAYAIAVLKVSVGVIIWSFYVELAKET